MRTIRRMLVQVDKRVGMSILGHPACLSLWVIYTFFVPKRTAGVVYEYMCRYHCRYDGLLMVPTAGDTRVGVRLFDMP